MTIGRRAFLAGLGGFAATPALIPSPARAQISIADGITAGDVTPSSAVVWARTSNTSRMIVDWSTEESFRNAQHIEGPIATARNGNVAQTVLDGLPSGKEIFYRVRFKTQGGGASAPATGRLVTPGEGRDLSFVFGGDQCGAGWGINPDWGGLRIFKTMLDTRPDFLIHLGDRIYADRIIHDEIRLPDGRRWRNIVTPAKKVVAESLDLFRGNYSYNFIDEHYRRFSAQVPMIATWDDHEVMNNWWPGRRLTWKEMHRKGYGIKDTTPLVEWGRQAFFEFTPMRRNDTDPDRIYRKVPCGPLADVFMLDGRSYRGPNDRNRDRFGSENTQMLGPAQIEWLKNELQKSKAVWKIIANPQPIAHVRKRPAPRYDQWANGDHGAPLGRELEIADILTFIKRQGIQNTVWLAADVHYSAAFQFDPNRAAFRDFLPFWEFVSGPFHARPGRVRHFDKTFGAERQFRTLVPQGSNAPPMDGFLYFGHARINAQTGSLRVTIRDLNDRTLFSRTLEPAS